MTPTPHLEKLTQLSKDMCLKAYAPYSKFQVGAALLTTDGQIITGCNVENASYGLTQCAERTAICAAVALIGPTMRIDTIVITTTPRVDASPCGACRQVIAEFGPQADVYTSQADGSYAHAQAHHLLPAGFTLSH